MCFSDGGRSPRGNGGASPRGGGYVEGNRFVVLLSVVVVVFDMKM
jgi:hypothetical protein